MSMSDTAEYWFDKNMPRSFNTFRHAEKIDCGHNHNTKDTPYIDDVECNACKKIIKETNPEWLKAGKAPETFYMSHREKKKFNKQKRFNDEHGKCPCGCNWMVRKNRTTGNEFLGCVNYPKCKNTKSLKNESAVH